MYEGQFRRSTDYKTAFFTAVTDLFGQPVIPDVSGRIIEVETLTEAYWDQVGEKPDPVQLGRLSDYLLLDELTDRHPDKVTNTEYPFLSERQFKLRSGREYSSGDVAYFPNNTKHQMNGTRKAFYPVRNE